MIRRLEVKERVVKPLTDLIRNTRPMWLRVASPHPVSYQVFSSWQTPEQDIENIGACARIAELSDAYLLQAKNALGSDDVTNAMVYGPMSCLYWHTNSNLPGVRTYYTFSLDKAVFRYRDPDTGEIKEDWDDHGWTVREFEISTARPLWHSVWTQGRRFSFGFTRRDSGL